MTQSTLAGFRAPETGTDRRRSTEPRPFRLSLRVAEAPAVAEPAEHLSCSQDATERLRATIGRADREMFVVLHLNPKNQVLAAELLSIGTIDSAAVYPREVMRSALAHGSAALIFGHNHPSGDTDPSLCDRELTRDLVAAAALFQIKCLDHIIIGPDRRRYFSFADQGLMDDFASAASNFLGGIAEAGRVAEPRAPRLRLGRGVVIPRDPAKSRRPTGAIYSAIWPRAARKNRDAVEAALYFRRTIREAAGEYRPPCECCLKRPAVVIDFRERYGTLGRLRVCADCYVLTDAAFWARHRNRRRYLADKAAGLRSRAAIAAGAPTFKDPDHVAEDPRPYALGPAAAFGVASRTFHTTPAFPRTLRGPRGGQTLAPTPCADCVAFRSCRPGACSAPFGCDSWVDFDGRRVDVDADNARLLALADSRAAAAGEDHADAAGREPGDPAWDPETGHDWSAKADDFRGPDPDDDLEPAESRPPDPALEALGFDDFTLPADLGPLFAVKSPSSYYGNPYWLTTRYPGRCQKCGRPIRRGERAFYFPKGKALYCSDPCGLEASARFNAERADEDFINGCGGGWA